MSDSEEKSAGRGAGKKKKAAPPKDAKREVSGSKRGASTQAAEIRALASKAKRVRQDSAARGRGDTGDRCVA
jgi:hypothetical protein